MKKRQIKRTTVAGAISISLILAPVFVYADHGTVGPGGSIEVDEGGSVDLDAGEGQGTDQTHIDINDNTSDESSESNASGSTNQTYVDDRTQDEKDLNKAYVQLRDLVESWRNKCNETVSYAGFGNDGNNITTIQYGHLTLDDITMAKGYLDSFNDLLKTGDVDEYWSRYYYGFDFRDPSSGYEATADPNVSGMNGLKSGDTDEMKNLIAEQEGLTGIGVSSMKTPIPQLGTGAFSISPDSFGLGVNAEAYQNGSSIRTDLLPGGLNNASSGSWYKDIESLYRYFDLEVPESNTGAHGKFKSNAMNDFCSIALIRNYKAQEVVNEVETIGDPISDDYQIHLFSEDSNGNRTEIDVLETNQRINTIDLSNYPGAKKIIAKTYRKFNLTKYTRVSYAEYEYLVDVGTNNILWYSEHSVESNRVGKTGCKTITMNMTQGISEWTPDPREAEIILRDLTELTENTTITERID